MGWQGGGTGTVGVGVGSGQRGWRSCIRSPRFKARGESGPPRGRPRSCRSNGDRRVSPGRPIPGSKQ